MDRVIAVLCSDIHLCHTVPVARAAEPDWYAAMARPLKQLRELSQQHEAPVVCAGDIFDDGWRERRCPPELINFAIRELPDMYAVPGQHDLPNHRLEELERTAYWTLVKAGKIFHLEPGNPHWYGIAMNPVLHGFPWKVPITPQVIDSQPRVHLAVVHSYIWQPGSSYPGASEEQRVPGYLSSLQGYQAAVFGDNHKGFRFRSPDLSIINCGTLMRRKSDEREYTPQVGLLHRDGSISSHLLDVSEDVFSDPRESTQREADADQADRVLEELKSLGADSLDYRDSLETYMRVHATPQSVRELVLSSLG